MAIVNKSARLGEYVPRGAEPGLTGRFGWRDADQEKAVRDIAAQRFNFPNPAFPLYKTFTNRPERQIGVRIASGDLVFPDIVVVDRDTAVRLVGEIESQRTLRDSTDAELKEKWTAFAGVAEFYLFVPVAALSSARRVIKRHNIHVRRLRTWRYIAGQDLLDVTDVW
jgi:hypothetical protein